MNKLILVFLVAAVVQLSCVNAVEFKKVNMREIAKVHLRNDTMTSGSNPVPQEKCIPKKIGDTFCDSKLSTSITCFNRGYYEKPKENGKWRCSLSTSKSDWYRFSIEFSKFGCEYLPEGDGKTWAIENSCWAQYTIKTI